MKFCRQCNIETTRYTGGGCKPCITKRSIARYYLNRPKAVKLTAEQKKEKRQIAALAYRQKNRERLKLVSKTWYIENKERRKAYESSSKRKAQKSAQYAANPDHFKKNVKAWKKANPHAKKIHAKHRSAKKRANGAALSKGLVAKLLKLQKGKCACCRMPLGNDYHLDHIMPLALGGLNTDDNVQLLRQKCNLQKHAKHPIDFMQSRGFLL